ncbi:MAG: hypothetical protein HOC20_02390 [Chloroflexi bacterium]|nr:hypothetical protein [Chloroflexota bacterium]
MVEEGKSEINQIELARWTELVGDGTRSAVSGLSGFVGMDITITALDLRTIPVAQAADLVGGAENEVVVIYVAITGGATGHLMLIYPIPIAFGLVDMLFGEEPGTTEELGEMEASALQEMGNVTGSFFMNSVADNTGLRLMPSPPTVMMDMAGAILDAALADVIIDRDELFVMETVFSTKDRDIGGMLLVLPTAEFMDIMMQHKKDYAKVNW